MMNYSELKRLTVTFISWRILLFLVAFLATLILPFKNSFPYWNLELVPTHLPAWIWGFGNFDGVHYLRLAKMGYSSEYTQAFFPIFPLLIKAFSFISYFYSGILISNLSFLLAIYFLYKLWKIDYSSEVVNKSILLLLAFPTAYYFGAIYSESFFLLVCVLSIYFVRQKKFLLSGIFAAVASATRVVGVFLWFVILFETWETLRDRRYQLNSLGALSIAGALSFAPVGLISYIIFLKINFNNPLYFLTAQNAFGAGRSSSIVLLPQVVIRYLKIFMSVPINSYPFFTAVIEFIFGLLPLAFIIVFFRKIKLSYLIFMIWCLILPTLTGNFSSMPRYSLMSFLAFPILASLKGPYFKMVLTSFIILQVLFVSLFVRGYWIA